MSLSNEICDYIKRLTAFLIYIALFLTITCLGLGIYLAFNPSDRIKVTTSQLPDDVIYISIVSESNGVSYNMNWYPRSELRFPFTIQPSKSVWSSLEYTEVPKLINWDAYVKWRWGDRYGLVTRDKRGHWWVTWFLAKDVPITGHWPILGNGVAKFELSKGRTIRFPKEKMRELHLHEFPFLEQ